LLLQSIVTGGAALTAFGGTGAVASSAFGQWMMGTSAKILGGTAFGSAAGKSFIPRVLTQTGNFLAKTAAKPFGAVGGALGSTARVGANIVQGKAAFAAGPAGGAPVPFSGEALSGQKSPAGQYVDEKGLSIDLEAAKEQGITFDVEGSEQFQKAMESSITPTVTESTRFVDTGVGKFVSDVGTSVVSNVFTGAAMASITETDPTGTSVGGAGQERSSNFDPLMIYAAANNMDIASIYNQPMYGNVDPSSTYGTELYNQQTVEVA
tara:strand:+ start:203 stop:997 length:795 start_codon:yes stop_codon:yes gene_type:complete